MAEGRTLIKTDTPGWFIDPQNGDKKTRKTDADTVITRAEYDRLVELTGGEPQAQDAPEQPKADAKAKPEPKPKDPAPEVELTTGKVATGKTITIRCAWVDPDKRTPKQAELFDGGFKGVEKGKTYEAVKAAAGGKRSAFPDGTQRVIKPQDAFQVRFSPDNQQKRRAELRRIKNRARTEAARAAAGA